ncbi:MAG: hypothetical protein ACAH80_14615 [Alphaproteobacteria bacterium]
MQNKPFKPALFMAALGLVAALSASALAAAVSAADMHAYALPVGKETHQPLRLKFGKPSLLQLDADIGEVRVDAAPANVVAFANGPRTVALFPKKPGAAHVVIRDKNGQPMMERYVFVVDPLKKYVKLDQPCPDNAKASCQKIYFCPNLCYQTHVVEPPPVLKD